MDRFILFLIEHYYYSAPLLLAIVLLIRSSAKKGGKKITAQELINLTNQNKVKLIDLRPAADFNVGHITGSINILFANLDDRAHEIKKYEDISLVLICETGSQSANAGEKLQNLGHKDNLILSGGINNWRMDNLPLI